MFAQSSFRNAASMYAKVGVETDVSEASPHKLILMLFDGALLVLNKAVADIESKDIPAKIKHITKGIEIISMGLSASLDHNAEGGLSERLAALYEYMCHRLTLANLQNNVAPIKEVIDLLQGLREAWAQIGDVSDTEMKKALQRTEQA